MAGSDEPSRASARRGAHADAVAHARACAFWDALADVVTDTGIYYGAQLRFFKAFALFAKIPGVVKELESAVAALPPAAQQEVVGGSAQRFYRL